MSARLVDASADPVKQLRRMVAQIRAAWREAKITIREDSGICRESIMAWCGGNGVGNILGLVRDTRLAEMIADESEQSL